nr:unnamed protein product [Callosobruchus analis]
MSSKSERKSKQAADGNVNSLDIQDMLQQLAVGSNESYSEEEIAPRDNRRNLSRRDRDMDRATGYPNTNAYREPRNDASTNNWRGEDAARNYERNLRHTTKFNEDNNLISEGSDIEEGHESEYFVTPARGITAFVYVIIYDTAGTDSSTSILLDEGQISLRRKGSDLFIGVAPPEISDDE